MRFGDFAVMFAAFQVVLTDVHFGNDALETDELVGHSAVKSTGGNKISTQIALNPDVVPIAFKGLFLFEVVTFFLSFKKLFNKDIVFGRVFDNLLGSLRELRPVLIYIKSEIAEVGDGQSGQIVNKATFILVLNVGVLDLHIGAFY